jgi:hypothetical protein
LEDPLREQDRYGHHLPAQHDGEIAAGMTDDLSERVPEQISEARLDLLARSMAELLAASMSYRGRTPIEVSERNCRRIISAYVQILGP